MIKLDCVQATSATAMNTLTSASLLYKKIYRRSTTQTNLIFTVFREEA